MSLRFALLALLTAQPMTGYDLAKAFHSSVGHVWHAPNSQIYPELRKMEREGLILGETVTWGTRGTKTRYEATPSGIQAFREWMATPLEYSRERDPAHLRAAYFEWTDAEAARAQLRAHREHFLGLRDQWARATRTDQNPSAPDRQAATRGVPESEWARITAFKEFAYEGLVAQADQEIAWADRGMLLIDSLEIGELEPARRLNQR